MSLEKLKNLEDALDQAKGSAKIPVRISNARVDPSSPATLQAHIETDTNSEKHNADVYLAVALNHVESQVLRGENDGKHLIHVAVVQQLNKVGSCQRENPSRKKPGQGKLLGASKQKF